MDYLFIGSKYDIGNIRYKDGSAFSGAPCVVLYNASSKKYYEATVTEVTGENSYSAVIPAVLSATIISGVYSLEIYTDSTRAEIIYYEKDYVKAIKAASSPDAETIEQSNS